MRAFILILLSLASPLMLRAAEPSTPSLSLSAFGCAPYTHETAEPLQLEVSIGNPGAANTATQNEVSQRTLQALEADPQFKQLPPEEAQKIRAYHQPQPGSALKLGSSAQPLHGLVRIQWTTRDGKEIAVPVRVLSQASKNFREARLDGKTSASILYVADPENLRALTEGVYVVKALWDSRKAAGMWQGQAISPPLVLTLKSNPGELSKAEQKARVYAYGRLAILDQKPTAAHQYAQRLIRLDPKSVSALELDGDAYFLEGKLDQSEAAFEQALKPLASSKQNTTGVAGQEPPVYLTWRLQSVREAKKKKTGK